MDFMPYRRLYNRRKNIDKLFKKKANIQMKKRKNKTNMNYFRNNLKIKNNSKEISMLMKHHIQNLSLKKED